MMDEVIRVMSGRNIRNNNFLHTLSPLLILNMKIHNIKVSFIFDQAVVEGKKTKQKVIVRDNGITHIIYMHTPNLVNTTGIKQVSDIEKIKVDLESKYSALCTLCRIDSIFIQEKTKVRLDLNKVVQSCNIYSNIYHCSYNVEIFNGLFLKPYSRQYPTVLLFPSGTFQLLAGKSFNHILETEKIVRQLIELAKLP